MSLFNRKDTKNSTRIFKNKKKENRPEICLSLNCRNLDEVKAEIDKYQDVVQLFEWRVDKMDNVDRVAKEDYIAQLKHVKSMVGKKKLLVVHKGDEIAVNRISRWSMGIADIIDIDTNNSQLSRLVREAHRKKTSILISYHNYELMPVKTDIAERYLRMDSQGGDILKIACQANVEGDTYEILEGAAMYSQLSNAKPIIAIAMGSEGQVSRICAGDFGSRITYASGRVETAPGQFEATKLKKYLDTYYKEEE